MKTDYVRELVGTRCVCGADKIAHQTFCRACYYALPRSARWALYQAMGEGYEQAYDNAVDLLRTAGRVP